LTERRMLHLVEHVIAKNLPGFHFCWEEVAGQQIRETGGAKTTVTYNSHDITRGKNLKKN